MQGRGPAALPSLRALVTGERGVVSKPPDIALLGLQRAGMSSPGFFLRPSESLSALVAAGNGPPPRRWGAANTCVPQACPVGAGGGQLERGEGTPWSWSLEGGWLRRAGSGLPRLLFPRQLRAWVGVRRRSRGSGAGPWPDPGAALPEGGCHGRSLPRDPSLPRGACALPADGKKTSPGRLPEAARRGRGGITGRNRLSSATRLRGGAGDRRGDSVMGH